MLSYSEIKKQKISFKNSPLNKNIAIILMIAKFKMTKIDLFFIYSFIDTLTDKAVQRTLRAVNKSANVSSGKRWKFQIANIIKSKQSRSKYLNAYFIWEFGDILELERLFFIVIIKITFKKKL